MNNQVTNWCIINGELQQSNINIAFLEPPVYEVIRVIDGIPLFFKAHMDRLNESLKLAAFQVALSNQEILRGIKTLVAETGLTHHNVRLEIGITTQGITWILFMVVTQYPDQFAYEQGVHTVTSHVTREKPHAKIFRKQYAQLISKIRNETQAYEVILVDGEEQITEGSRSNLFFIKNGKVITAQEKDVLLGISRMALCKVLKDLNIGIEMRVIPKAELKDFEACFLTGTSTKVLPIATIDAIAYPSVSHPIVIKLIKAFDEVLLEDIMNLKQTTIGGK